MKKQVDYTGGTGDPDNDRTENFLGLGEELKEVVGDTAWWDQYGGLDAATVTGPPESPGKWAAPVWGLPHR
ncbi:hypothetical protein [Streptomyces sp. TS71-3]|uniref:hypothetical protein n=1 Tax=Streptomyces sp. TS71-3 TaxID=2733862 RepID=UPI001B1F6DBD|nr:hypothetical protein [Streptomyces sp. TS71-3]GHJ36682.1 hypothetical protein Sm713_22910 [Streptomyces sp. TS71-3]